MGAAMKDDLVAWVADRIDQDAQLDDDAGLLILAALDGESQLDGYIDSGTPPESAARSELRCAPVASHGVFLRSMQVTGFRGIGAGVSLDLEPGPGLTVVAGRNGSGKSSLAEGLELLLTGETYRWKNKKSTQWSEQWRNLHYDGPPEINVEMVEEGAGPLRMVTRWDPSERNVSHHTTTAQRTVEGKRGKALDAADLGWATPLETFRPMLSYDELGAMLMSGPSELYDAISKVLGTEQLADAIALVSTRRKQMSAPQNAATKDRKELQADVADLDDERGQAVATLLNKASPDTARIRALTTGVSVPDDGLIAALRALAYLEAPEPQKVATAATRVRSAVEAMAHAGEAEAGRRIARLELRRGALHLHGEYGEQSCPVCSQGALNDSWAQTSRELVEREDAHLRDLSDARAELDGAREALAKHAQPRPPVTDRAPLPDLETDVSAVRTAWDEFAAVPDGDLAVADHLELRAENLASTVAQARERATGALAERDNAWAPLAARISAWCNTWDDCLRSKPMVDRLAASEKWLKERETEAKNERLAPISDAAKHAWALLRQESNVDLGDLRLEGQATRRRVTISANIDGVDVGGALTVMSQGELHALTLALFLPRASLDDSPFRFVILDDPVQAMDPAKVDGLASLLAEIAQSRQVVVFSHDDRLPAALRRGDTSARIVEVHRGSESAVHINEADDPSLRYISDAEALCSDDQVPPETLRRVLPGLLRMAIEAAARDRFYATRLTRGEPLGEVEQVWSDNHATRNRVSLAIYDDVRSLDDWLRTETRKKALGIATSAVHHGLSGIDPREAVHHARRVVTEIKGAEK